MAGRKKNAGLFLIILIVIFLILLVSDSGEISVKDFGAKGDGIRDDTLAIQNAINSSYFRGGGTVYIPGGIYLINPDTSIVLRNNIKLKLSSNAILKAKPTYSGEYDIVLLKNVTNVEIVGGNIVGERDEHKGTTGTWGMGIGIYDSNSVTVTDISISKCWGDGIYIGSNSEHGYNSNIDIERFTCDNNRRMGLTVISAKNLTIKDGVCSNTHGTEPQSGLNLEPNYATQILQNILIENFKTVNNGGYGLDFWLGADITEVPISNVSIIIKNHIDHGSIKGTLHDIPVYISKGYNIEVK